MTSLLRTLLLLGLLALLIVSHVRAQDDGATEAAEEEETEYVPADAYEDAADQYRPPFITRAIFPNSTSSILVPKLPAGAPSTALIAFQNNAIGAAHQLVLVAGYLQPLNSFQTVLQNFSVVRQARTVQPSETVTVQYTFTPDASFEPGEYSLVIGVYFADVATNETSFAVAYNGTVYVDEALGTDPRTILTYITLMAIFGAIAFYVADRFHIIKMIEASRHGGKKSGNKSQNVEMGTGGQGYDPDYVSKEHLRYRDDVMRKSSASPKRQASASPKKKN